MVADFGLLSDARPVVISWKLCKQGRPSVMMELYEEVGTADSVAAFRSSPDVPWEIFSFQIKDMFSLHPPVWLAVRPHQLSAECEPFVLYCCVYNKVKKSFCIFILFDIIQRLSRSSVHTGCTKITPPPELQKPDTISTYWWCNFCADIFAKIVFNNFYRPVKECTCWYVIACYRVQSARLCQVFERRLGSG